MLLWCKLGVWRPRFVSGLVWMLVRLLGICQWKSASAAKTRARLLVSERANRECPVVHSRGQTGSREQGLRTPHGPREKHGRRPEHAFGADQKFSHGSRPPI